MRRLGFGFGFGFGKKPASIGIPVVPMPEIGEIFNNDFSEMSDLSGFTEVNPGGSNYTLDGGYLKISGTPSNSFGLNALMYDGWVTGLENWELTVDYIVKSHASGNAGLTVTFKNDSTISSTRADSFVHYRNNGSGGDGQGYRYFNDSSVLTPNTFISNPLVPGGVVTTDDTYRLTLTRTTVGSSARFTLKIENLDNPEENEGFLEYDLSSTAGQLDMSSSKLGIGTIGGEHWVKNMRLTSTSLKNPDFILIGNSMSMGYCASTLSNRYMDQYASLYSGITFTRTSCQGDKPSTAVNKQSEIELIAADRAILMIGSNQVISDGDGSTRVSFQAMTDILEASGIPRSDMFIINVPPRAGNAGIDTFNAWLESEYTDATIINANRMFNDGTGNLDALYDIGDGIHLNDAANDILTLTLDRAINPDAFLGLSWKGNTNRFTYGVDHRLPTILNTITRDAGTTFVDVTLESNETIPQGQAFTLSGDLVPGNTDAWFSIGQEGLHAPGIDFNDLEYALRCDNATTTTTWSWWESGSSTTLGTTTGGELNSWSIEYDGANGFSININNGELTHTATSSYTTENLAIYLLGRDSAGRLSNHIALKLIEQPNSYIGFYGDSITFGGAADGGYSDLIGCSYIPKTLANLNNVAFANPILAESGVTSSQVLTQQVPRAADFYNVAYDKNIATLMVGINDLRISRNLALIQADIQSIVSNLQAAGYTVVIMTVIRDHSSGDFADRLTLNTWILAGNSGADFVCNLTTTDLETDPNLFEDGLHPNPFGMRIIADNLSPVVQLALAA